MNTKNRQLKFRAWHPELKYLIYFDNLKLTCISFLQDTYNLIASPTESVVYHFFNTEETIQQFTGLQDKNGKDIYEGDIVKYLRNGKNGLIKFEKGSFVLDCIKPSMGFVQLHAFTLKDGNIEALEKIGNIFESPELLQEKT